MKSLYEDILLYQDKFDIHSRRRCLEIICIHNIAWMSRRNFIAYFKNCINYKHRWIK